jgi:hypothetical protein
MPELSSLTRAKPTTAVIEHDGDTITLTFDRNRVTPAWVAEASRRDEEQDPLSLPKALASVISEWDVTNDGPFPPTAENIAVLSYGAQRSLLEKIMVAAVPSDAEGKASASQQPIPSSVSTPATSSPNGTVTSTLPVPSASPSQT